MQFGDIGIVWLGHDSFRIRAPDLCVYVDPYKVTPEYAARLREEEKADVVLITHDHFDHCEPQSVDLITKSMPVLIAPVAAARKLGASAHVVKPLDRLTLRGMELRVMPAYNVHPDRLNFHPKAAGHVGYLITMGGQTIYHLGDTDMIPEMADLTWVDIALVPVSGTYVMDAREAAEWVKTYKPKVAIPMHHGSIVGSHIDANQFKELVGAAGGDTRVEILPQTK